jgi:ketosteroid isomerase-like protein
MSEDGSEVIRSSFEAIRTRDIDALVALYDPNSEFRPLTGTLIESGGYRGHEGIRAYFQEVDQVWEMMDPYAEDLRVHGEIVVAIGGCRVRGRESGAEADTPMAWVFRLRDGLILSTQAFSKAEEALSAAGLVAQAERRGD